MKFSTRTIVVLAILGLTAANPAPAQNTSIYTISGKVALEGVMMRGLPGDPVSDSSGYYNVTVPYGWSGTVIPVKEGFIFDPPRRTYDKVVSDQIGHDYQAKMLTFTISGSTGMSGVELTGLPGNPITNEQGLYSCSVLYGWAGMVSPKKDGYHFNPQTRSYTGIRDDMSDQNYDAKIIRLTISGDVGQPGVVLNGLPGSPVSDREGTYSAIVEYGWSGIIEPVKEGVSFNPPQRQYDAVKENYTNENYWPTQVVSVQTFEGSGSQKAILIPTSEVKAGEFETTMEDMRVMLYILEEKVINEPSMIRGILTDYGDIFGQDGQSSRAVYIQDYGVLFLMEVDFPLVFQSEPQQEDTGQVEGDVDPVWQQAREQVFSPKDETPGMMTGSGPESIQQRVEQLKKEFIRALKHASNIRNLGQDEWIILNVVGLSHRSGRAAYYGTTEGRMSRSRRSGGGIYDAMGGSGIRTGGRTRGRERGTIEEMYVPGMGNVRGGGGYGGGGYGTGDMMADASPSTVLTIRASKSDIDAFAEDKINFEEFQSKVQVFVY